MHKTKLYKFNIRKDVTSFRVLRKTFYCAQNRFCPNKLFHIQDFKVRMLSYLIKFENLIVRCSFRIYFATYFYFILFKKNFNFILIITFEGMSIAFFTEQLNV